MLFKLLSPRSLVPLAGQIRVKQTTLLFVSLLQPPAAGYEKTLEEKNRGGEFSKCPHYTFEHGLSGGLFGGVTLQV